MSDLGHPRVRRIGVLLIAAALLALAAAPVALGAGKIYWANANDTISYANLDGSGGGGELNLAGATPSRIRGVTIDAAAGRIYWTNSGNNTVSYANLDGTGGGDELNISGATPNYPHGTAVDPAAGKIYWANDTGNTISYAKLDGTGGGGELNLTGATPDQPYGVAIDAAAGRIYWANVDVGNNTLSYTKLDGTGGGKELNTSGATPDKPHGVAIDPTTGKIYWGNLNNTISYARLDGTGGGGELKLDGAHPRGPLGVAVDPTAGKVYWANLGGDSISYAKLDGSGGGGELNLAGATPYQPRFVSVLRSPDGAGAPQVTGSANVGSVLSCSPGSWAPDLLGSYVYRAPQTLAYQWSRNGADIAGATDNSYTAFAAGAYRCRVTATNAAGSTPQTSGPHTVVAPNHDCAPHGLKFHVSVHPAGLERVIVSLDGTQITSRKDSNFDVEIPAGRMSAGRHKVEIERDYRSGTTRRTSFTFTTCKGGGRSPHIRTQGIPTKGSCTAKPFKIVVTATGAVTSTIAVRLDGKSFSKPKKPRFTLSIDTAKLKAGAHRLTIAAQDKHKYWTVSTTDFVRCG
jgi:DNA-binding beta-propeller fold protein YncE